MNHWEYIKYDDILANVKGWVQMEWGVEYGVGVSVIRTQRNVNGQKQGGVHESDSLGIKTVPQNGSPWSYAANLLPDGRGTSRL